jgi:hypothetical protein
MSATIIVSLIGLGIIVLTNFALLVKDHVRVQELVEWREDVDLHINNLERHIDPKRDGERWSDLIKRVDKMDRKLDNILTLERDNNFKRKGDSEDA